MEKTNDVCVSGHREITINSKAIPIKISNPGLSDDQIFKAIHSRKFLGWAENLNLKAHNLEWIELREVYLFSSGVGFICLYCRATPIHAPNGRDIVPIPGYVFLRGDAVSVLVVVVEKETNKKYVVFVHQYRTPYGDSMYELPAGMMDEDKNFKGKAVLELEEEAGINLNSEDLKELIDFGPSLGGCDEKITMYYCEVVKSKEEIEQIQGKLRGEMEKGENITVQIVEFDVQKILGLNKVHPSTNLCAIFAYQNLIDKKD